MFIGAAQATYPVEGSGLPTLPTGCQFSRAVMSKGEPISDGIPYTLGARDVPRGVSQRTYAHILRDIHQRYVVLWDETERRGWLINGTTALLHLLRASLESRKTDQLNFIFEFRSDDIQEARLPYTARSPLEVLTNSSNRALKVYKQGSNTDDQADTLLGYQIDALYDTLEKLMDHQELFVEKHRQRPGHEAFAYLEGWDFKDVAVNARVLSPRTATFDTPGKSWPALVQSVGAVTLFGRGFGDIILPEDSHHPCSHWNRLPAQQNLLAVLTSDLTMMMTYNGGSRTTSPRTLTNNIAWRISTQTFESCPCSGAASDGHVDRVQVLQPSSLCKITHGIDQPELPKHGAVLFHYNGYAVHTEISYNGQLPVALPDRPDVQGLASRLQSSDAVSLNRAPSLRPTLKRRHENHVVDKQPRQGDLMSEGSRNFNEEPPPRPENRDGFHVAIICARPTEGDAVQALLDGNWDRTNVNYGKNDEYNSYTRGWIGQHNVVLVQMPGPGKIAAAHAANALLKSFPNIKLALVVGVCGGVPIHPERKEEIV
jgi:hypothetical protein